MEPTSNNRRMNMKKILRGVATAAGFALYPIISNATFFIFMFVLGTACGLIETADYRDAKLYPHLFTELFTDLYLLCAMLAVVPRGVRCWLSGIVSGVLYAVALVDVWCFVRLGSTITPSMLMLVGETTGNEASEFLKTYLTGDTLFSPVGVILAIIPVHIATAWATSRFGVFRNMLLPSDGRKTQSDGHRTRWALITAGAAVTGCFIFCLADCLDNKKATARLLSYDNIGSVEHELTKPDRAVLYMPVHRLVFSIYANRLTARQLVRLVETTGHISIDSCTFRSPDIVLIIGESYNRHHSQLYGYDMPTTPRQAERERHGELVAFSDVISPWNLTSYVFKHVFSLHSVGDSGQWCDRPLFPELFKKAGYHVTFVTNQFLPKKGEAVYDFSGGFFLNNPELSAAQFSTRNTSLHRFDDGVLADLDSLSHLRGKANLTILHLMGQHVNYYDRTPRRWTPFRPNDYRHRQLKRWERGFLADYDNATLYNDSIVDEVLRRFEDREAIVIYMPDHGEECFGDDMHVVGRLHSATIDYRLAHEEFEIPFWIWRSRKYAEAHPDIDAEIKAARNRPFMTDDISHMLLYLGGIACPDYRDSHNLLSHDYDSLRPRMIKNTADYDKLRKEHHDGKKQ